MRLKVVISVVVVCIFFSIILKAQVMGIQWNTFAGSASLDKSHGLAMDSSGNIFVTGYSDVTWGSPINAHSGSGNDAFVAKLDSSGNLIWNTFFGGSIGAIVNDISRDIILDSMGNIYVAGDSDGTWGSPVHSYTGNADIFIACLNSSGNLVWNTFLGSASWEQTRGMSLDSSGNIYVTGYCDATWGSPINAFSGGNDAFVVCLNNTGNLIWNTFLGCTGADTGESISINSSGNIYMIGRSGATWGLPVNTYSGGLDAVVACLNSAGTLLWHTFLGSTNDELGLGITQDSSGNIYVTGDSYGTWGSPVSNYNGNEDMFAAKLNSSGNLLWNTFLGSAGDDFGYDIALDSSGNIYLSGGSNATWGSPVNSYNGSMDAVVACLNSAGTLLWHTFLGSAAIDWFLDIVLDSSENIYVSGDSYGTWGSPVNPHSGNWDAMVVRIKQQPLPDITANGSDGPISINESDTLQIRVSLNTLGLTDNVDYWLAYRGPSGWIHFNNSTKKWESGLGVTHQGALMDLNNKKVFQKSGLAPGVYKFYFGVDMVMDGKVTKSSLYKDEVQVTVTL